MRWTWLTLVLVVGTAQAQESLKGVLLLPPVSTVTVGKKGAFVGVDTRKTVERFDAAAHKRLVGAFDAKLKGKVLRADVAQGLLDKAKVTVATLDKPGTLEGIAKAANVDWLVTFSISKNNLLTAQVRDSSGKPTGESVFLSDAAPGLSDAQAARVADQVVPKLLAVEKARLDAIAEAARRAEAEKPLPPEELVDAELQQLAAKKEKRSDAAGWVPDRSRVRAWAAIGPGTALRGLEVGGEGANQLAELENGAVAGLGVAASIQPLEFIESLSGKAWSQLSVEVHYRRAFVQARGVGGSVEGETCTMTDDDLQLRLGWRYRLGGADSYLPTIGLAGGWSAEQTRFECSLPLLSTTWRGVDAQLRVRQPLYKDVVTLELVGGPRFLLGGPLASPGFSLSGEAWLEVKPLSILFTRAGVRASRLTAANPDLSAVDSRAFFAVELGAFF
ncbi:MAG TPA: hypothetical protein VGE37_10200 [Archangium sp.]